VTIDDIAGYDNDDAGAPYMPMPDEIAAACKRIQSRWTDTERKKRAGIYREQAVTLGLVSESELGAGRRRRTGGVS
jgi:hypothetical protein